MRIEIDGRFAIDRSHEAFVIQRYSEPKVADHDGRFFKKGDTIGGKWVDDCYPTTFRRALEIVFDDAMMLAPGTVKDLKAVLAEVKRVGNALDEVATTYTEAR